MILDVLLRETSILHSRANTLCLHMAVIVLMQGGGESGEFHLLKKYPETITGEMTSTQY